MIELHARKERTIDESFFARVNSEEIELSTGAPVGLPIRYLDWTVIMADFPVPAGAVRRLLPAPKLLPAQFGEPPDI